MDKSKKDKSSPLPLKDVEKHPLKEVDKPLFQGKSVSRSETVYIKGVKQTITVIGKDQEDAATKLEREKTRLGAVSDPHKR